LFVGCSAEEEDKPVDFTWDKHQSSNLSKSIAEDEERDIKLYLEMRPEWKMEQTGSGLRYWIYEEGDGETPRSGEIAEIEYVIELLSGEECYRTEEQEYEEVTVDHSDLETGVQEALKIMQVGDKAKLIVPSHIAHGLLGDLDKVPPLSALVINLELTGIKK
jgi:FKBP-type peptidyl-prolyl cis-trans isomerase